MRPQASIRDAVLGLALLSCACQAERAPEPAALIGPSAELAKRAVSALLPGLQFGPDQAQHTIRELRAIDVPGSHYTPATDRWTVHYCAEFLSYASDAPQRRCDLAVDVYPYDASLTYLSAMLPNDMTAAGTLLDLWVDVRSRPGKFFLAGEVRWSH